MAQMIQIKKEEVITSAQGISCKAKTLQKQEMQEDHETNITVKEKAIQVYLRSQEMKERYQENMAQNILENVKEQYKSDIGFFSRVDRLQQSIDEVKVFKDKRMEELEEQLMVEEKRLENTIEENRQELWD